MDRPISQRGQVDIRPISFDGYQLLHDGVKALAQIERNGMRIDVDYCRWQDGILEKKVDRIKAKLEGTSLVKEWRKLYSPDKFKWKSDAQLRKVLYETMGYTAPKKTEKEEDAVDVAALETLGLPELQDLIELRRLNKVRETYLGNILLETNEDGFLRPFFHLHIVRTYRSSSSDINFQNIPVRIPEIGKLVRRAFLPRHGRKILEIDYSGVEVRIAACYHKDPTMLSYIFDPATDMHRDTAMMLFGLPQSEVSKTIRHIAKNKYVFPQFYGDWYKSCAKAIWEAIPTQQASTKSGEPLFDWLSRTMKITTLAQFERQVEKVENKFWNELFPVYTAWKDEHVAGYEQRGYFESLTGFRYQGVMRRNEVINYAVQGSAFHCLLRSLIRLQQIALEENWKSCWIGQIHDSILGDVEPEEEEHVLRTAHRVMCEETRKVWPWVIVPLEAEADITPINGSWHDKAPVAFPH